MGCVFRGCGSCSKPFANSGDSVTENSLEYCVLPDGRIPRHARLVAMSRLLLLLVLILVLPAHAQNVGLDPRFGVGGMVSLRDPAQTTRHYGLASCGAPGGGLSVVVATAADKLTLFRLLPDGRVDTSFSGDGMASITVPASSEEFQHGACLSDGRIVIARMAPGVGADRDVQLLRVRPEGELDSGFGVGGVRVVDFDAYEVGLANDEMPFALNLIAGNELLLSARLPLSAGGARPAIARIDASGNIAFARIVAIPGMTATYAAGAGIGGNGRIWVVGGGYPDNTTVSSWFRAELDPVTGATLQAIVAGGDGNYLVAGGRMLASGVMVALGKFVPPSEPGGPHRPHLLVFRDTGTSALVLPALTAVNNSTPTLAPWWGGSTVIPTSDGRVLAVSAMGGQNGEMEVAVYTAEAVLGASAAEDRVETRYGDGGARQFAYPASAPCANGSPPPQRIVHATNWRGQPTLTGIHSVNCDFQPRNAMVVRLLNSSDVFFDSFE